jgi:hypothetical protein
MAPDGDAVALWGHGGRYGSTTGPAAAEDTPPAAHCPSRQSLDHKMVGVVVTALGEGAERSG